MDFPISGALAAANLGKRKQSVMPATTTSGKEESRAILARKIAQTVGSAASQRTDVPGLTLFREVAPTAPWSGISSFDVILVRKAGNMKPGVPLVDATRVEISASRFVSAET